MMTKPVKRFLVLGLAAAGLGAAAYGIKYHIRYTWPKPLASMQDLPPLDRSAWPKTPAAWSRRIDEIEVATPQGLEGRHFTNRVNSIGMELMRIEPGAFWMGVGPRARVREGAAAYRHRVSLTRAFYLGISEVSNREFELFDPGHRRRRPRYQRGEAGDDHPVEGITWQEAQLFCRWLSGREGRLYRLPTEAEWEYACKAGTETRLYWGDAFWDRTKANTMGWKSLTESWADDGYRFTAPAGCFPPNPWGLFDMVGNAREWVNDWYGPYPTNDVVDPVGPPNVGRYRVMKGAGWNTQARFLSNHSRDGNNPADRHDVNGFRVLCETRSEEP